MCSFGKAVQQEVQEIEQADICVVNYETLRSFMNIFGNINWARVVLDEGQKIKDANTKTAKAVAQIPTTPTGSRWVLSGKMFYLL